MIHSMFVLGVCCLVLYVLIRLVQLVLVIIYAWRFRVPTRATGTLTILQPILSGDPALTETISANLDHATNETQFIWLVDDNDTVGQEIANKLRDKTSKQVQIITCPPCPANNNPKVFKLQQALPLLETEFTAVLDDDTILGENQISQAIGELSQCDVYTGLPSYTCDGNAWSSLLAHFVNNNSIVTYVPLLNFFRPVSINGMFYVLRTSTLKKWDGWSETMSELCDDYAFSKLAHRHGARIRQGLSIQRVGTSVTDARHYRQLMHRWFLFAELLVRDQPIPIQLLLLILLGLPPLLLWGSLCCLAVEPAGGILVISLLVLRHAEIRLLHRHIFRFSPQFSMWRSLVSELLQPIHALHAFFQKTIIWRSRRIRVHRDGTFSYIMEGEK